LGKGGAVILAAKAALRSGVGKATAFVPQCVVAPVQSALPEAMCLPTESENHLSGVLNPEHFDAIAFGMGAGTHAETARLLKVIIQNTPVPLVLDADALNILAEEKTWLAFLPARTILTPHPGELDRICGKVSSSFDRWQNARALAFNTGCIVVLKGAYTRICLPDGQTLFNSSGNAGMATAGAGDVLSGIIAALLASGYSELDAAVLGVFAHGMAGDFAAAKHGETGMIAGDVVEALAEVWKVMEA
jgi:NAD(P)H-hydrate epimerase